MMCENIFVLRKSKLLLIALVSSLKTEEDLGAGPQTSALGVEAYLLLFRPLPPGKSLTIALSVNVLLCIAAMEPMQAVCSLALHIFCDYT